MGLRQGYLGGHYITGDVVKISVITPTANRQYSLSLMPMWMGRQTIQPHEWIVVDGGLTASTIDYERDGCKFHHVPNPNDEGVSNFLSNLALGVNLASGDVILIMEDDELYHSNHIEHTTKNLANASATVSLAARYYNIRYNWYREWESASLCRSGFRRDQKRALLDTIDRCKKAGNASVDYTYFADNPGNYTKEPTAIGVKGMYANGISTLHKQGYNYHFKPDDGVCVYRKWFGEDARYYDCLRG